MENGKKLNVVVVPSYYPMKFNYAGNFFEEQIRLVKKKGINISVVYNENRSIASFSLKKFRDVHFQTRYEIEEEIPVLRRMNWNIIPAKYSIGKKIWVNDTIQLVEKYIRSYGTPDLIHVHCIFNAGSVAQYIKEKWHIPYIITEHSSNFSYPGVSHSQAEEALDICRSAERIVTVSTFLKNELHEKIGLDEERTEVIPNFIDTEYFSPVKDSEAINEKILLTVCHAAYVKRLDRLLEAFKIVSGYYPEWKLIIGGKKIPGINNAEEYASKLKIQNKVAFPGFLTKEQVREYMKRAAIVVSSSDVETFGVLLIEAMSMGVPVVATASGGPADSVTKDTGILVEKNAESLAKGIMEVISKYDSYDRGHIREYAIKNFSGKIVADRYVNLYQQCALNKI